MASTVRLDGPFAAIRFRAILQVETGPYAPAASRQRQARQPPLGAAAPAGGRPAGENVPGDPSGATEPYRSQDVDHVVLRALQVDRFGPGDPGPLAGLRRDLTAEAQRIFDSSSVEVIEIRFRAGSLEILVILGAAVTFVKDFGSIVQGLREMGRLIPGPLRDFLESRCGEVLQGRVLTRLSPEVVEVRPGMRDFPGRADDEDAPMQEEPQPGSVTLPPTADGRMDRYLLVSNVVLTVLLAAIVIVLLVQQR